MRSKFGAFLRLLMAILLIYVFVLSIYAFVTDIKHTNVKHMVNSIKNNITITKDYKNTSLVSVKKTDNYYYYDEDSKEIRENISDDEISYKIVGNFGKIFKSPIVVKQNDYKEKYNGYEINYNEDGAYYKKVNSNVTSKIYDDIEPLQYYNKNFNFDLEYLVLKNDNNVQLLNTKNNEVVSLKDDIKDIFIIPFIELTNINNETNNNINYFVVKNNDNKYGLVNRQFKQVIDYKYDMIYNLSNVDEFVALKDGKYGVISPKDEIILDFEYDYIEYVGNYKLLVKNNSIGVLYNNKIISDFVIPYHKITANLVNNELSLITSMDADYNSSTLWDDSKSYLFNTKGLIKQINGYLISIKDNNNDIKYFYSLKENNNSLTISFYDSDYYEYFNYNIPIVKYCNYDLTINKLNDKELYEVNINYNDEKTESKSYYIDLFNSKVIDEKNAIMNYFENGYGFTLSNNELKIYKDNNQIASYKNITNYLGDYYFLSEKSINKLEFK